MPAYHDDDFRRQRDAAFDKALALIDARRGGATPVIVAHLQEKSPQTLQANARMEVWSLFVNGIKHLKDGAPDGQPGAMAEAIARASLRSSTLAAALGIRPPQFEPIYFSIDYTTGAEAALFLCQRLVEAAAQDFQKSRHLIQQKILAEKPAVDTLKEQMALSFDVLAETYERVCGEMKEAISTLSS